MGASYESCGTSRPRLVLAFGFVPRRVAGVPACGSSSSSYSLPHPGGLSPSPTGLARSSSIAQPGTVPPKRPDALQFAATRSHSVFANDPSVASPATESPLEPAVHSCSVTAYRGTRGIDAGRGPDLCLAGNEILALAVPWPTRADELIRGGLTDPRTRRATTSSGLWNGPIIPVAREKTFLALTAFLRPRPGRCTALNASI